ncbi:MAG: hypothetical protein KGL35_07845 [Bradyrhizobium sp.]|uniref:hypothetical protein n=1 Tax=Bradyrhizobium sp. TaxID=376 RepID=UPI001C28472B|nr:hypothetical protein [Bradyrhizobium sp.]MBU6465027.1 hypothetical protein [Pseudomonadota bacterium]MDE2066954.1 hypothetical protein [Bradyrhizobium sp.]MDE2468641.1 hypothetical protein [Bradyrhizobium sp.]
MARFPWPVTDEELILDKALASVLNTYNAHGDEEEAVVEEAAARLIIEAYNQGIRDEAALSRFALRALRGER